CVRPGGGAMIAVSVGNEAVLLRNGLALWLPGAEVREGTVHKHDGRACPLVEVGKIDAIHTELTRLRGFSGPNWHGEGTAKHMMTAIPKILRSMSVSLLRLRNVSRT